MEHIQEVQNNVRDYIAHRAYLEFSWTPLSDEVISDMNREPLPKDPVGALVAGFGRIFLEVMVLCVTYPIDIVMTPVEVPRELVQIGVEHLTFPQQAKRMARLTGDLTEQDFSRKISDGKYQRLKAGLISAFSGQSNPQI